MARVSLPKAKVENMVSPRSGRPVANQFLIYTDKGVYFQSYRSVIAVKFYGCNCHGGSIWLDSERWDYSVTTGKYRNQFLMETKKETEAKIASGEYKLCDLNN